MRPVVGVLQAGTLHYAAALKLQSAVQDRVRENRLEDTLIVVEHPPVYTVGLRDKVYSKNDEERLKKLGADFHRTNRGGLITFHGPGQMVVYPILNLKHYKQGLRWYVGTLEKTIIALCEQYGLEAYTSPHTGVWVADSKICAIGVHASRYVTTHGIALNCNTDLKWFDHIVPCGIPDKSVTSLTQQLNREVTVSNVLPALLKAFEDVFLVDCRRMDDDEVNKICRLES